MKTIIKYAMLSAILFICVGQFAMAQTGAVGGDNADVYVINKDNSNYDASLRLQAGSKAWVLRHLNSSDNLEFRFSDNTSHGNSGDIKFRFQDNGSFFVHKDILDLDDDAVTIGESIIVSGDASIAGTIYDSNDGDVNFGESIYVNGNATITGKANADYLILDNEEVSSVGTEDGTLYFDRNFYEPGEAGDSYFMNDGGGLAVYNDEDGWSAMIDTKNMDNLQAHFYSLEVDNATTFNNHVTVGGDIQATQFIGILNPTADIDLSSYKLTGGGAEGLSIDANGNVQALTFQGVLNPTANIDLGNFKLTGNGGSDGLFIESDGDIGIGTLTPQSKLSVNGKITTKEVEVTPDGWADFVFAEDYLLPGLDEVETYIHTHKRLPGLPSAEEVLEEGINLGEMNATLLQKIEELTLYVIGLQKQNEALQAAMNKITSK